MKSGVGQFFSELRLKLPGLRALVLLGPSGELLAYQSVAPAFDAATFAAEHATLLRIAQHALQDTGMGDLQEQILLSQGAVTVLQRLSTERFIIFVCSRDEHVGRIRYELKRCLLYSSLSNL